MATKSIILETNEFQFPNNPKADAQKIHHVKDPKALEAAIKESGNDPVLLFAPSTLRKDKSVLDLLQAGKPAASIAFLAQTEDLLRFVNQISLFSAESRSTGVKDFLESGSTIYTDTIFNMQGIGVKLDSCFRFTKESFDLDHAVSVWGSLQSAIFLALKSLPEAGEAGSGEKMEVQIGSDSTCLAFSIRFDLAPEYVTQYRQHSLMTVPTNYADIVEIAYLQNAKKLEVLCLFFRKEQPESTILVHTFRTEASLENNDFIKEFSFKPLNTIDAAKPAAGAKKFRKKFSEQVAEIKPTAIPSALTAGTISAEALGGSTKAPPQPQSKELSQALSKIENMETILKQREQLIAKLNKEIEEIKDPLKMNVISNIKDTQTEALKRNIERLETEIVEFQDRERELMAIADKTVQIKDDAMKKVKELETKLRLSLDGNNGRVITLEKQIEEQKRQNKELSKKLATLADPGKRSA